MNHITAPRTATITTSTLAGNNTYGGGTTHTSGGSNLNINSTTAIGTGALNIVGGIINNTSGSAKTLTTNNAQNWNGNFTFTGSNALDMGTLPDGLAADASCFDGNDLKINITSTGGTVTNPYLTWAGSAPFDTDANGDGVSNGLAFMLGAASPTANVVNLLPVVTVAAGGLTLSFSTLNAANRGTVTMNVQHSSGLGLNDIWSSVAVPEVSGTDSGVVFVVTPGSTMNAVQATIPATDAAAGRLFGRLRTVNP